ncbi:MAG TPA: tetraacyldisaccharide 4'-kinase [Candidatus Cloacimonadota bacterium]|nr:tetraacyldisaccharide 4'-kinase [Candidatus Cloacimonadota bacterium]
MAEENFVSKHWFRRSIISRLLYPVSLLFKLIVSLRRKLYSKIFHSYKPSIFTISIGNITVGGSGKTPFTIYLAEILAKKGIRTAVSARGYKSVLENKVTLISDREGLLPEADLAGDEAWLLAKRLPEIPIATGKKRKAAIQLLYKTYPDLECIILDDSFQHLQVQHDLDFVLINAIAGFGNGFILPAGPLREPVSVLRLADFLILNHAESRNNDAETLLKHLQSYGKPIYEGYYKVLRVCDFTGRDIEIESLSGEAAVTLCGIGNPSSFISTVKDLGIKIAGQMIFPDHYAYNDVEIKTILNLLNKSQAQRIVTTEKDFAKLRHFPDLKSMLIVLQIGFCLASDEEELSGKLIKQIREKGDYSGKQESRNGLA